MHEKTVELLQELIGEPPDFDLACVGTSIRNLHTITVESLACLAHADVIYHYPVTERHLKFMQRFDAEIIDLNSTTYRDGADFEQAYADIISEILARAATGKKVVYAQQGSPAFLAYTSIELVRRAKLAGLKVAMVPGVSSFECISAELSAFEDLYDVQLCNCASLVRRPDCLDPGVACLLFNLARFANPVISKAHNRFEPERVARLQNELRRKYPGSHRLWLIVVCPDGQVTMQPSTIETAAHDLLAGSPTTTIFVPPLA